IDGAGSVMKCVAKQCAGGPPGVLPYEARTCVVSPCAAQPCVVPPVLPCGAPARHAEPLAGRQSLPEVVRRVGAVVPLLLPACQRQVPLPPAACPFVLSLSFLHEDAVLVLQPVKRRRVQESFGSIVRM